MRRRRCRWIGFKPNAKIFKPVGTPGHSLEIVELCEDELEAVRLSDLLEKDQVTAAQEMGVSQPTFHRILASARKKIADAIVNGKMLRVIEVENVSYKERENF